MADTSTPKIDLNTADLETLMTLPGIGWELAERIIEFREAVHPFDEPIEIAAVKGISERMYRQFADRVTVSSVARVDEPETEPPPKPAPTETAHQNIKVEEDVKMAEAPPQLSKRAGSSREDLEGYLIVTGEPTREMITRANAELGYVIGIEEPKDSATNFWRPWLLMVVGALLGTFLSLSLLYVINDGALAIANNPTIVELNRQLAAMRQREIALNKEIDDLKEQLNAYSGLDTRLRSAESQVKVMQQKQDTLIDQITTMQEQALILEGQVTTLEEQSAQMQESIGELLADTGRFRDFLVNLRELLLAIEGLPERPVEGSAN
jgi:hypothetical protein